MSEDVTLPNGSRTEKDEIIEVVKYPFEETMKMIEEGRITDALTLLALQRSWFHLQKVS